MVHTVEGGRGGIGPLLEGDLVYQDVLTDKEALTRIPKAAVNVNAARRGVVNSSVAKNGGRTQGLRGNLPPGAQEQVVLVESAVEPRSVRKAAKKVQALVVRIEGEGVAVQGRWGQYPGVVHGNPAHLEGKYPKLVTHLTSGDLATVEKQDTVTKGGRVPHRGQRRGLVKLHVHPHAKAEIIDAKIIQVDIVPRVPAKHKEGVSNGVIVSGVPSPRGGRERCQRSADRVTNTVVKTRTILWNAEQIGRSGDGAVRGAGARSEINGEAVSSDSSVALKQEKELVGAGDNHIRGPHRSGPTVGCHLGGILIHPIKNAQVIPPVGDNHDSDESRSRREYVQNEKWRGKSYPHSVSSETTVR